MRYLELAFAVILLLVLSPLILVGVWAAAVWAALVAGWNIGEEAIGGIMAGADETVERILRRRDG